MAKSKQQHWTDALRKELSERGDMPQGDGWMTREELCKSLGKGENFVLRLMRQMIRDGKVEVYAGRAPDIFGRPNNKCWYRGKLT